MTDDEYIDLTRQYLGLTQEQMLTGYIKAALDYRTLGYSPSQCATVIRKTIEGPGASHDISQPQGKP